METQKNNQKSPNIIFNLKGFVYGRESDENAFVRCQNKFDIVGYNSRESALSKSKDVKNSELLNREYLEVKGDISSQKESGNIVGYASQRKGSAGSFNKDKFLDKTDLKNIRKELRKTKSTVWTGVISFTPIMAQTACNSAEEAQKLVRDYLPALCKGSNLDFDNLNYFGSFHVNTDNPHIHIVFWEKEPTRIDSLGRLNYNYNNKNSNGLLPVESLRNFKFELNKGFSDLNYDFLSLRDDVRSGMRDNILKNADSTILKMLFEQNRSILTSDKLQYARFTAREREQIDKGVQTLIQNNPKLEKTYNTYIKMLMEAQAQTVKLFEDNHMKPPERATKFYDTRAQELKGRLGNEFLKSMRSWGKLYKRYDRERANIVNSYRGDNSTACMRHVRLAKSPFRSDSSAILRALERSLEQETQTVHNNLKSYYDELRKNGVTLIYDEDTQA